MTERVSRKEAKRLGLKRYFSNRPCLRGHVAERSTANNSCFECTRIRQRSVKRIRCPQERLKAQRSYLSRPENREKHRCRIRLYRARKREVGGKHSPEDVQRILKQQKGRCAYCKCKLARYEVDHIHPVISGGTNDARNIQLVCRSCNAHKSDLHPVDFARRLGLLC